MMDTKVFSPAAGKGGEADKLNIDSIIARLLEGKFESCYVFYIPLHYITQLFSRPNL